MSKSRSVSFSTAFLQRSFNQIVKLYTVIDDFATFLFFHVQFLSMGDSMFILLRLLYFPSAPYELVLN